ncbi:hypothetical protein [Alteromonas genovensis]|uniref:hypothetical protein n=1 Tax=Alteromonas genovensis TaxID=471225 RepID=UPI002FE07F4D
MEEVVEGFGRFALRIIKWIVIQALIEGIVYGYGYVTLKIFTLGKYPRSNKDEGRSFIAGCVSIVATFMLLISFYQ